MFYMKCWQSATEMHHKITTSLKKKKKNKNKLYGIYLNFQIELLNVIWMNVMLWRLARWLQIILYMWVHRDCLDCILLTLQCKEDYSNFCLVRLPVFQGKPKCHSETILNTATYLYNALNTQSANVLHKKL